MTQFIAKSYQNDGRTDTVNRYLPKNQLFFIAVPPGHWKHTRRISRYEMETGEGDALLPPLLQLHFSSNESIYSPLTNSRWLLGDTCLWSQGKALFRMLWPHLSLLTPPPSGFPACKYFMTWIVLLKYMCNKLCHCVFLLIPFGAGGCCRENILILIWAPPLKKH